jgi:hypothetical protein
MKKIAFLSCGLLRTFEHCFQTWNVFDSCDIFVYTWETTSRVFTDHPCIPNFFALEEAKKNKYITNYEVLLDDSRLHSQIKNAYLWNYASKHLSWDYDYVLISRPDITLYKKHNNIIYPKKGEISLLWYNHEKMMAQDTVLFMRRDDFVKFAEFYDDIKDGPYEIHYNLYKFIKNNFTITDDLNVIDATVNRPITNTIGNTESSFRYIIQQDVMCHEYLSKFENAAVASGNKRTAILLVTDREDTLNHRHLISQRHQLIYPFFFESKTEEMARDKCSTYEKVTGFNFDEILVEIL